MAGKEGEGWDEPVRSGVAKSTRGRDWSDEGRQQRAHLGAPVNATTDTYTYPC